MSESGHFIYELLQPLGWLILSFFLLVVTTQLVNLAASTAALFRLPRRSLPARELRVSDAELLPKVTLIVPMFNEEPVCADTVRSLLRNPYPDLDIIVVNDGSGDATMDRLVDRFDLIPEKLHQVGRIPCTALRAGYRSRSNPRLVVLDKPNGGRSDAVNLALNHCAARLVCIVDGDGLLDSDALFRLSEEFLLDRRTVAAGGYVRIGNAAQGGKQTVASLPSQWLGRFQVLEYMRAFVGSRTGWSRLNALPIISGALGMYRLDMLLELGGLDVETIGEDLELTLRIHRHFRERRIPYRVAFASEAVVWTEAPSNLTILGRQRDRWHRGLAQVLIKHRRMAFNPRFGAVGLLTMPYLIVIELLGPLVEAAGYVLFALGLGLGVIGIERGVALLAAAWAIGALLSIVSIAIEERWVRRYGNLSDLAILATACLLESFAFRQMTVFWRLRGLLKLIRGDNSWGAMTRTGFGSARPLSRVA